MYSKMISKENVDFKSLEEKIYKYVCEIGLEMLKKMLEKIDDEIFEEVKKMKTRDLISHDKVKGTIKTRLGECTYIRRKYYEYETKQGKKKYKQTRYLLDEIIETKYDGMYSEGYVECVLNAFVNSESYRLTAKTCEELTNERISHESVRRLIFKVSEKEMQKEQEIKKANEKGILIPKEQKEIGMLFGEIDGLFINLQGKDKKKIIDKKIEKLRTKYEGKELEKEIEKISKMKIKKELKMGMIHEGWKKVGKERYALQNKEYIVGFDNTKEINKKLEAKIVNKYKIENIKHIVINGDGASWISKIEPKKLRDRKIYQRDSYHICKELNEKLDEEHAKILKEVFKAKEYKCMRDTLDILEDYYIEDEKRYKNYKDVVKYISKGLERYTDVIKELPKAPEGIEYRTMGNAESNIYGVLSSKLSSKRKSFSIQGALSVAYIMKEKILERDLLESVKEEIKIDNSEEEWIKELERKARKNKYKKYEERNEKYEYPIQSSIQEVLPYLSNRISCENIVSYCFN